MNCELFRQFVDAMPLRERDDTERALLEEHAQACETCSDYLEAARSLQDDLAELPEFVPSEHFDADVMQRVRTEARATSGYLASSRLHPLDVGAVAAGIGAVVLWVFYRMNPEAWTTWLTATADRIQASTNALYGRTMLGSVVAFVEALPGFGLDLVRTVLRWFRLDVDVQEVDVQELLGVPTPPRVDVLDLTYAYWPSLEMTVLIAGALLLLFAALIEIERNGSARRR